MYYCTLEEAKTELSSYGNTPQNTVRADDVMRAIRTVTRRINQIMVGRSEDHVFLPQIKTRKVPLSGSYLNSSLNTLRLDWPLLSPTTVLADGSAVTSVVSGYPQGETPYRQLRISSSGSWWYSYISTSCGDPAYADITGVWGWHSDYANAWEDSGATLTANVDASATEITTSGIDSDDLYGDPYRLSRGALIKIDDEFMLVIGTSKDSAKATLKRGVLGSTAAAHSSGDAIYVWQVEEPIRSATARQAGLMLARRGAYQTEQVDGITLGYPPDLLLELARVLTDYING